MTKNKAREGIFVSFHYLEKGIQKENGDFERYPFAEAEFQKLCQDIAQQKSPNLKDKDDLDQIRGGKTIPFSHCKQRDARTFSAVFRSAYWGHAFENSDKGNIDALSVNLRDFCFFLYKADNGCIYIAAQYLGNYGDYTTLSNVLKKFLKGGSDKQIRSHSIHSTAEDLRDTVPTEVKINLSKLGNKIDQHNIFDSGTMIALKGAAGDEGFTSTVREKLLALRGNPVAKIKKEIAKLISENERFDVNDDDVNDCKVVVRNKRGGTKTIYLFDQGHRATMYHLNIKLDNNGKLRVEPTLDSMLTKFKEEVIPAL